MNKNTAFTLQKLDQLWAKLKEHGFDFNECIEEDATPTIQMQYLITRICALEMSLLIDFPQSINQRAERTKGKPYSSIINESATHLIELFRHRPIVACIVRYGPFTLCKKHDARLHIHVGTVMFLFIDCELKLRELGDLDVLNEYET